ncbi:MAG: ABC transporter substrate-binding protein [Negativicutes bacterium]|nr:ABC transporter substrate-binding protein [Negativicutes bacterium]
MKKWLAAVLMVMFVVSLMAGCSSQKSAGDDKNAPIKIGVVTSLTGERALTGQYTKNGVLLAIEDINGAGGINGRKLEAVFEDDNGNDAGAVNAYNKLSGSGVSVILGPIYSNMDLAISPSIKKAEIPTLVMGSSNDLAKQKNPWMFQARTADAISATAIAKYAAGQLKLKKIAILHETDNFASGAAAVAKKALEDMGQPPVLVESYNGGDKDFTPVLAKIKASGAEGVLAWSQQVEAGLIMKQMKSLDLNVALIGSNSYITKIAIDLAKENAENVYSVADYVTTTPVPKGQDFAKRYKAKYNIDSEFNSAMNYDAISLAAEALKKAGSTDKNAIRQAMAAIKDFVGVSTTYTFDENNVGGTSVLIVQTKNGVPQVIEAIKGR